MAPSVYTSIGAIPATPVTILRIFTVSFIFKHSNYSLVILLARQFNYDLRILALRCILIKWYSFANLIKYFQIKPDNTHNPYCSAIALMPFMISLRNSSGLITITDAPWRRISCLKSNVGTK